MPENVRASACSRLGSGLIGLYVHKTMCVYFCRTRESTGELCDRSGAGSPMPVYNGFSVEDPRACPFGEDREQEGK